MTTDTPDIFDNAPGPVEYKKIQRRDGAKWPPNLTFHARRQASIRGMTLDRLTNQEQEDWKAATGYQDHPPRWILRDHRTGKVKGYHYTLSEVLASFGPVL